ncbi:ubiquitin-related domain-containing protein, partial [Scleroderma citrinum]
IPQTPQITLTFLLVSGRRKSQSFDPETTVGRVKELVWNAWPTPWPDERPPAPSYLRILYLGKILQDDDTLIHLGFPTSLSSESTASPTIVHLSIRPYAPPSDDPTLSKKRRLSVAFARRTGSGVLSRDDPGTDDADRTGCCSGCVVC